MLNISSRSNSSAFVVVDVRCRIKYVSTGSDEWEAELKWILESRFKLQPEVETFIRSLSSDDGELPPVRVGLLSGNRVLRVVRVVGSDGTMFILSVEEDRNCNSLVRAARRHGLTRRETEVLSLILDGCSAGEIAGMLALSEHTVQGYFKRLLFKTGARNRVSMVASMFDWDTQVRTARPVARAVPGPGGRPVPQVLIDATA
jgi:DNA-binding CsgD family transcriptional regulator